MIEAWRSSEAIQRYRAGLMKSGALERRRAAMRGQEFHHLVVQAIRDRVLKRVDADPRLARLVEEITAGRVDPYTAAAELLASLSLDQPQTD